MREPQGWAVAELVPLLQREGGRQQGGAGHPGVLQGQGEAGGVSWRVSVWGTWGARGSPPGAAVWASHAASPRPPHRDVSVELPFVLMHPKPHDHITLPRPQTGEHTPSPPPLQGSRKQGQGRPAGPPGARPPTPLLQQLLRTQVYPWTPTSLNLIPSKRLRPCLRPLTSVTREPCSPPGCPHPCFSPPRGGRAEAPNPDGLASSPTGPVLSLRRPCVWEGSRGPSRGPGALTAPPPHRQATPRTMTSCSRTSPGSG